MTEGSILGSLIRFSLPLMAGNLLQQCYNLTDMMIVGRYLGANALAAVGGAYTIMVFLTSVFIGLCMGCGAVLSIRYGASDDEGIRHSQHAATWIVGVITLLLTLVSVIGLSPILQWLQTPPEIMTPSQAYLSVVCGGMLFTAIYNFFAFELRAVGNSLVPLYFLVISTLLNIILDLVLIVLFPLGIAGAAWATVIAQAVSGAGLALYTWRKMPQLRFQRSFLHLPRMADLRIIGLYSFLTCAQQSVMNFGILLVQGLVNSFGTTVMAAFAAGVKIDTLAYMPLQDFGNAFSTFVAQNFGAGRQWRIRKGVQGAWMLVTAFSVAVSALTFVAAPWLMQAFVDSSETEIITIGVRYLRIEGIFYLGIGYLFLFYGFYRGIALPGMSLVLTILSLGTRVMLAYILSAIPAIGTDGIWWAIPIGWMLADVFGWWKMKHIKLMHS